MPSIEQIQKGHIFYWDSRNDSNTPQKGHIWLILGGCMHHITGTDTICYISDETTTVFWATTIPLANPSSDYPLYNNNTTTGIVQSQPQLVYITDKMTITKSGGAGCQIRLIILDFLST